MAKYKTYTDQDVVKFAKEVKSMAGLLRKLNLSTNCGGNHQNVKQCIQRLNVDTSHWTGRHHLKGKISCNRKTASQFLVSGCKRRQEAYKLRRSMLELGVEHKCVKCNIGTEYNGEPLCLQVDHINNDWSDNRKENLQFLCPNCHNQKTLKALNAVVL